MAWHEGKPLGSLQIGAVVTIAIFMLFCVCACPGKLQ